MIDTVRIMFVLLPQVYIFARAVFVPSSDSLIFSASLPGDTAHVLDDSKQPINCTCYGIFSINKNYCISLNTNFI